LTIYKKHDIINSSDTNSKQQEDTMACGGAVETQTGTGKSKLLKRAIHKAFQDAVKAGALHCVGGSCSGTQKCGYVVTDIDIVSVEPITSGQAIRGYEATVSTDGGCACTDW
jgi:hypothetical protein